MPADQALEVAARAAVAASAAAAELDHAIAAARADGHSWRTVATVTGVPHQTLHRRARRFRSAPIHDE